ncbi:MAG: ComEC/Rec2 family competence protein, partial [Planctomycetota bacterium]
GGDAPVARAVIFGILGRIATLRGGGANLLNALALALLLLGAWGGGSSRGLVLSFSAVTGILLLAPGEGRAPRPKGVLRRLRRGILRGLRVSSGAWLGASVPLLLWTPEMVPWGPIFSLLFLPLLGALLATGVLSLLPGASLLDPLLGPILCAEVGLLEGLARLLDHLPATPWSWPPIPPIAGALAVASVAAFIRGRASRGWPVALILLAALAALRPPQGPGASLISLGRGQGLLIRGEESTLLLDAGSVDRAAGGAIAIRDTLRAAGRDRCDLVLLSHPHADHVLALPGLLERIPIGGVAVGPRFGISPLGAALLGSSTPRGAIRRSSSTPSTTTPWWRVSGDTASIWWRRGICRRWGLR